MLNSKKDTIQIIQIHAIMNFWLACQNIDKVSLIDDAFKLTEEAPVIVHLFKIFNSVNYNVFEFIAKLDTAKRGVFLNHIMTQYKGITHDAIKDQYMTNVPESKKKIEYEITLQGGTHDYLARHHMVEIMTRLRKWDWSVRKKGSTIHLEYIKADIYFKIHQIDNNHIYLNFESIKHHEQQSN